MTILYKLTDENDQTCGQTQWGENISHTESGEGGLYGQGGWIHAYTDPLLAIFLNPLHDNFKSPHLWEAEGEVEKTDHGLRVGTTRLTTIRRLPLPDVTTEHYIKFAILCTKERDFGTPQWHLWADKWLSGEDRSKEAAMAAEAAANASLAEATVAAVFAASAAADATCAASVAAKAAYRTAVTTSNFDLIGIAKRAIQ